jgi:hypothetical protein
MAMLAEVLGLLQRETSESLSGGIAQKPGEGLCREKNPYKVGWTSTSL